MPNDQDKSLLALMTAILFAGVINSTVTSGIPSKASLPRDAFNKAKEILELVKGEYNGGSKLQKDSSKSD